MSEAIGPFLGRRRTWRRVYQSFLGSLAFLALPQLAFSADRILDKEGKDVQTLSGFIVQSVRLVESDLFLANEMRIRPSSCVLLEDGRFDCTKALLSEVNKLASYSSYILLKPFIIKPAVAADASSVFPEGLNCSLIEMKTVIRKSLRNNSKFEGLGFYAGDSIYQVSRELLVGEREARLLMNNEPALIDTFLDVSLCRVAGASYTNPKVYEFKPFASFEGKNSGETYRVWEALTRNHALNPASNRQGFDRSLDIIRPLED